ncbi:putative DNA-directed RNA polymerase subunit beta [Aeromonas phage ZPAH34]|uniref:putative DNA-directed RNA polymerase subunit beta n=1 Tax=Aeromonas phage ZPAH34 TaxID=2924888 RepID=UPI002329542B|nr:putative DNA-directed RNA polymerase subunit beta [Aeromonas phage ZPAH34]UOX39488.1 putative DNA-directed RNA polymerase subunit beta [Aeromonas phage ZPAH34]
MKNRKEIETDILFLANRFTPSGFGEKIYTSLFKTLTDDQFKQFWNEVCDSGFIPMFVENDKPENAINYDDLCKLAKELDIPLEQSLIFTDPDTGLEFETPKTAIVGIAETRKQRQLLTKKFGASKHDHEIEDLTGQPTGDSKAGGISNPEIQVLLSLGLKTMAKELADVRGGDIAAYRSYKSDIIQTGTTTTQAALKNGNGVKSLRTAHFLLRAQLLDNNLG